MIDQPAFMVKQHFLEPVFFRVVEKCDLIKDSFVDFNIILLEVDWVQDVAPEICLKQLKKVDKGDGIVLDAYNWHLLLNLKGQLQ
jgi:alpha-mannosidase